MASNVEDIPERLAAVRARLADAERAAGREPGEVALLAVSKRQPSAAIRAAAECGQRRFGESYLQEAVEKMEALAALDLEWHFIGPLQSNKTRDVAARFAWAHSLDRLKVARRLSEQRPDDLPPLQVCIQVNVSGEASKSGVTPGELPGLAEAVAALPRLRLRGLMTLPAPSDDPRMQRAPFRALAMALSDLRVEGFDVDTLSMGMSGDLEAAVAEGATIVRVGTDIFGARG